jgi:DNA-binding transcriptional LysR family regulator
MKLHQLKVFDSICRNMNVTAAAAELCMSQPAVSLQLKLLEDEFGIKLFDRNKHGMQLTDSGRKFLDATLLVLESVQQLEEEFRAGGAAMTAVLIVGVSHMLSKTVVPDILTKYREQCPLAQVELTVGASHSIENSVAELKIDIALINNPRFLPDCEYEAFQETSQDAVAVVPAKGHDLSQRASVTLEELAHYPLIVRVDSPMLEAFRTRHLKATLALQCHAPDAVQMGIRRGLGIGLITRSWVQSGIESGDLAVISVPEIESYKFHSYIVRNRRKRVSSNAQKLIAAVREVILSLAG